MNFGQQQQNQSKMCVWYLYTHHLLHSLPSFDVIVCACLPVYRVAILKEEAGVGRREGY